jgi:hypothetical protein
MCLTSKATHVRTLLCSIWIFLVLLLTSRFFRVSWLPEPCSWCSWRRCFQRSYHCCWFDLLCGFLFLTCHTVCDSFLDFFPSQSGGFANPGGPQVCKPLLLFFSSSSPSACLLFQTRIDVFNTTLMNVTMTSACTVARGSPGIGVIGDKVYILGLFFCLLVLFSVLACEEKRFCACVRQVVTQEVGPARHTTSSSPWMEPCLLVLYPSLDMKAPLLFLELSWFTLAVTILARSSRRLTFWKNLQINVCIAFVLLSFPLTFFFSVPLLVFGQGSPHIQRRRYPFSHFSCSCWANLVFSSDFLL